MRCVPPPALQRLARRATRAARCRRRRRRSAGRPRRRSGAGDRAARCGRRRSGPAPARSVPLAAARPVLLRPRPPRRRRRFFGRVVGRAGRRRGRGGVPGRVSPTRGLRRRRRAGGRVGARRRGTRSRPARSSPASSRACSAMSSSVRPAIGARPPSSLRCPPMRPSSRVGVPPAPGAAAAGAGRAGLLAAAAAARAAPAPLLRRAVGPRSAGAARRVAGRRPCSGSSALAVSASVAAGRRPSARGLPFDAGFGAAVRRRQRWVIRSVLRLRSVPVRTSMPSLMTRAPPAHAGACRRRAVPTACRRARSIGGFAVPVLRPVRPARSVARAIPASTSPGLALRGCVMSSISTLTGFVSRSSQRRMNGSTSSSTSRPLRRCDVGSAGKLERTVDVRAELRRVDRCAVGARRARPATRPRSPLLATPAPARRAATAPVTAMPSGNASVSDTDSGSRSTSSANTRSRYSASLSCPVDSASPKLTFGRGEKPSVNASGSWVIRNARSSARATSRWRDPADLARASCTGAGPDSRRRPSCRTSRGRRRGRLGAEEPDRDVGAGRSGPGPCPGSRPRARAARPPRARGRSRCTPRSRSRESTGNRGARARPGPPASRPRGNRGAGPAAMWSQGSTSSRVRWRVTYQSGSRPSACIASSPAVEREVLAPLLERAARPPDRLDDPADPAVAAAHDALGERRLRVVPLHLRLGAPGRVAQQRDLAAAARRRCSGRTTGTACAASARTRRPTPCSSPASCTCARCRRRSSRARAIPSVSSSISVGRPVRK